MKVVDSLFKKIDIQDKAYNCTCVCNVKHDLHGQGSGWTWLPWNTCGCGCYGEANRSANNSQAKG